MPWSGENHSRAESSTAGDRVHLGVPRTKSRSQRSSPDSKSLLHLHISQLVLRHRDSAPALVESPDHDSSTIASYLSEYSAGTARVVAEDHVGAEDFSDNDLRHSHCPLRRKSSLPVRFLGVGTTPSVVISDFSCSEAVDGVSLDMLKDEWQRRLSSASSASTISSYGGFDRSRRGSLLDLDAEGLVMSGDGRLERADLHDLICSPALLLHNSQQEHASGPPDIAEYFPNFDSSEKPSCDDFHNLLRSDDVQDTSDYPDRQLSLESDSCSCQRAEEDSWSDTHVRYSIAAANRSQLHRRSVSLEQMSTLRDVRSPLQCTATKASQWKKVRSVVQWTPFVQTYKKQKYPWIQLAGHQGNFRPSSGGTILKKLCGRERICLQQIMSESLKPFVPEYRQTIVEDDKEFLQMQDLLGEFRDPCVMDCKMGVRTYLEEELAKAREKPKLRKDMYEKMLGIDKAAPTEEEHRLGAVTKPRYMVWRETISSTATLGFRIEGIRRNDGFSSKDFKTTRTREQVAEAVSKFTAGYTNAVSQYLDRLRKIKTALLESPFFRSHELIGSSLLFVHDSTRADVWLIDFAKTTPLPNDVKIGHDKVWQPGNHEDGYLLGVDNLISILSSIASDNAT